MQKTPFVFPIIGGRKVEHLLANLEALEISLTAEQMKYLESVVPFETGFPNNIIVSHLPKSALHRRYMLRNYQGDGTFYRFVWNSMGHLDRQPALPIIQPASK